MSINKRNIDTDERGKPSQGNAMPSGTGAHAARRREVDQAEQDPQRLGAEGRKAGTLGRAELALGTTEADIDAPMTAAQAEHLQILCEEAGEPFDPWLTQAAGERRIRALQRRAGYKP